MRKESVVLLSVALALVLVGVFMVYSAGAVDPHARMRLTRQFAYVGTGLAAMAVMTRFDYHRLRDAILFRLIVIGTISLLIGVLVPGIGDERKGAQRWIEIAGFSFQPSELGKVALILLLAVKLTENQEHIRTFWRGFMPPAVIAGVFAGLVLLEKDLGAPVVLAATAFLMMAMAGVRWRYLLPSVLPALGGVYLLSITSPYRVRRLVAFLDPWQYARDEGYQLIQSMAAFARGAIMGQGAGAGEQKLYYLPEAQTDFVFAVWAEEMGLVGTLLVVGLFCTLVIVALRIAIYARDVFGSLLAGGIASLVGIQAVVNIAVVTGMLPTKGLPLPFISWGGSSLIVFMGLMGILISVGLQADRPARARAAVAPG